MTIGGQNATVNYCGMAPHLASGVLQINAVVPAGIAAGNIPVSFTIGGVSSPAGVTVAIKSGGAGSVSSASLRRSRFFRLLFLPAG